MRGETLDQVSIEFHKSTHSNQEKNPTKKITETLWHITCSINRKNNDVSIEKNHLLQLQCVDTYFKEQKDCIVKVDLKNLSNKQAHNLCRASKHPQFKINPEFPYVENPKATQLPNEFLINLEKTLFLKENLHFLHRCCFSSR